jgi:hypothetical protein
MPLCVECTILKLPQEDRPNGWTWEGCAQPIVCAGIPRDRYNGTGWFYYCVNCKHTYDLDTLMDPGQADCCPKPRLHVYNTITVAPEDIEDESDSTVPYTHVITPLIFYSHTKKVVLIPLRPKG